MLAPISWLKDFVDIKTPLKNLMWKMTEAGLTCESFKKVDGEIILDVEVTPNRPDWLSIIGIAREIAALQKSKIKFPRIKQIPDSSNKLHLKVVNNFELCPRYSGVIISAVNVKPSPKWLQERLKLVGLRPINNLVDISNYVMFEMGNPIHVFDYDKFKEKEIVLTKSKGNEVFTSVDDKKYNLPKDAIILTCHGEIIDLCGIKGGANSGVTQNSKNIFIHSPVYNGKLIRRTSLQLGLSSEASRIFERGANAGGTLEALKKTVQLTLKLAGGTIASKIIDHKKEPFNSWAVSLSFEKLYRVLGIEIHPNEVVNILKILNLSPRIKNKKVGCIIPTYRGDIRIEEDLIEEVARIWGYNKFPKTLPSGSVANKNVPYFFDDSTFLELKTLLFSIGFSETMSFSLISQELIVDSLLNPKSHIKIANPVSRDYEYLRTSLIPSLLHALNFQKGQQLKLFELAKVYLGIPGKTSEPYHIAGVLVGQNFKKIKGVIDLIFARLNINKFEVRQTILQSGLWHPTKSALVEIGKLFLGHFGEIHPKALDNFDINEKVFAFELDADTLIKCIVPKVFKPVSLFPPQIEDLTFAFPKSTKIGSVIESIQNSDNLIDKVILKNQFTDNSTFRIWYQDPHKTLNDHDVRLLHKKIVAKLSKTFGATVKD